MHLELEIGYSAIVNVKKHIPNLLTLGNLFCGCLAIVTIFAGNLVGAAYLVGIALIFDFFDGFAARLLKVSSPIGKDLDSLADMVTFGVVPGLAMYNLIYMSMYDKLQAELNPKLDWLPYCAFIIPIFSAVRLAKFNNDTRQTTSFIGLPTPANAMVICSLPLVKYFNPELYPAFLENPYVLCLVSLILSLLLVAEIPLFALKFKNFAWKGNEIRYVFLLFSLLLLSTLKFVGVPLIIILYIFLSLWHHNIRRKKEQP